MRHRINDAFLICILLLLHDRVEFLYYAVEYPEKMIGFIYINDKIRFDSYIYYASIRIQNIIFAFILDILLPELQKETLAYVIISLLYFVEYFWSYNEPTAIIRITESIHIPISVTFLKLIVIFGIIVSVIQKILKSHNQ